MSNYNYILSDYHAVKHADIALNGITVLAGENGCGKSTLSRWLYYLINATNRFEEFVYRELFEIATESLLRVDRVRADITAGNKDVQSLQSYSKMLISQQSPNDPHQLQIVYISIMRMFEEHLTYFIINNDKVSVSIKQRVLKYLGIEDEEIHWYVAIGNYCATQIQEFNKCYDKAIDEMHSRSLPALSRFIKRYYPENESIPSSIQLYEDNAALFRKEFFSTPYMLHRAIYIDTPMALSIDNYSHDHHWNDLKSMMLNTSKETSREEKRILFRIADSINGKVSADETNMFAGKELRYHRKDGLDILLTDAATGIKSFAYLQRLLENGYINEETLLLIDEPEAHLHPQWIVEFARLLVLLHKKLKVKIMIASHNPDMVSAIQSIARKEEVLDSTCFYQAYRYKETTQYTYKNLGSDITEIFQSFNIALSRIQDYGADSL